MKVTVILMSAACRAICLRRYNSYCSFMTLSCRSFNRIISRSACVYVYTNVQYTVSSLLSECLEVRDGLLKLLDCFRMAKLSRTWVYVATSIFYARQHICYSAYILSPVRPSVRLSVTRVYHRKTAEVRIMKFSPYGSPIPLVFETKFYPEILGGSPTAGC